MSWHYVPFIGLRVGWKVFAFERHKTETKAKNFSVMFLLDVKFRDWSQLVFLKDHLSAMRLCCQADRCSRLSNEAEMLACRGVNNDDSFCWPALSAVADAKRANKCDINTAGTKRSQTVDARPSPWDIRCFFVICAFSPVYTALLCSGQNAHKNIWHHWTVLPAQLSTSGLNLFPRETLPDFTK